MLSLDQHLGVWFWKPEGGTGFSDHPFLFTINAIGGFAGPLFLTLSGVSASLFTGRYQNNNLILVLRGLTIIFFGFLLNILVPCWFSPGSWFTLHMIGFGLLVTVWLKRCSTPILLSLCLIVIVSTVIAQNILNTPLELWSERLRNAELPGGVLRLMLFEGHFPVFPWLSFFIGGMVTGRLIKSNRLEGLRYLSISCYLISAVILMCYYMEFNFATTGFLFRFFRVYLGFYPATPIFFFLLFPTVIVSLMVIKKIDTRWPFRTDHPLVCLGRSSLTIFILHIFVFKELAIRFDYFRLLSSQTVLFAVLTIMIFFAMLSVIWQKYNYKFGAEWVLRQLAPKK